MVIAGNVLYNEIWDRVHALAGNLEANLDEPLEKLDGMPFQLSMLSGGPIAAGLALVVCGRPREAHDQVSRATSRYESLGASKFAWRSQLVVAQSLLELGRPAVQSNFIELRRVTSELADVDVALAAAEDAWLALEEQAP